MFAFAVGQCCCSCTDCCGGSPATSYDVDITLVDSACYVCDSDLSGTYNLTRSGGVCEWSYFWSGTTPLCRPGYGGWYVAGKFIRLGIYCVSDTEYQLTLAYQVQLKYQQPGCRDVAQNVNTYYWIKRIAQADFACGSAADFAIPYSFYDAYGLTPCWSIPVPDIGTGPFCTSGADALITAV